MLVYESTKDRGKIVQINLSQVVSLNKIADSYYLAMTAPLIVGYNSNIVRISKPSYELLCGLSEPMKPSNTELELELLNMGTNNG